MKDSLVYQVQQLLKFNKIAFDKEELAFQIKSHPSYPSLHAITGVLDHFNIENLALDVPVTEGTLSQLPSVFLAQINTDYDKEFAVIKNEGLQYELIITSKNKSKVSLSKFLEKFTGIIVAVEKDEEQIEYKKIDNTFFKNSIIMLTAILFIVSFILAKPSLGNVFYFFLSILGIYISLSIYKQELGEESVLGNAFCSGESEKKSCDDVLTSKGANIYKNFKLSDLSIVYFSGLTIATYLISLIKIDLTTTYLISALAIPITIYSFYYQYIVVKKWCMLCLSIVAVLWAQALIIGVSYNQISIMSINSLMVTAFAFSLALMFWNFISPLIKNKKEHTKTKIDYFKFKKNFNLFNTLLNKSKTLNTEIKNTSEIVFGNINSNLNITIITNPFCGHCKAVHTLAENIIKKYSDLVKITVRFNINSENPESDTVKITGRLLEIYHTETNEACLEAMHDIYAGETVENWLKKWNHYQEPSNYLNTLKNENEWCINNAINFTPEILINGKAYPKEYDKSDLMFFIEELEENCCQDILNTITHV